ncbi:M48 family metalloprotease [Kribbella sp. NPDC048928]|uniref:M48 family metalloprotease n=1 Tax=Kribbella sp. NPDC048928 TaxID=3364111 RepID=UPI00371192D9
MPSETPGRTPLTRYADLVPALGWLLLSFACIYWACGFFFDLEAGTWIAVLVWLLSGGVVLLRPVEDFLARIAFRLRRPTNVEEARLGPIWNAVVARFGVADRPFALWIQEAADITGPPTAGHTVAVTHWSLYTLPPSHLEAVLAHELTHHLRGRAWLSLLGFWYSLPARMILAVLRLLGKLFRAVPALGCLIGGILLLMYLGVFISMLIFHESIVQPSLYLLILLAIPLMAWLGRWTEREADRAAAEFGYGPKLIEVFYGWQATEGGKGLTANTIRNDLLSGQPRVSERIRALEKLQNPR